MVTWRWIAFRYGIKVVSGLRSMTSAGGKGGEPGHRRAKSGSKYHYISKIGNGTFGHFARRHLKGVGFNAVTLLVASHRQCAGYVAGNSAKTRLPSIGANMTVTDDEIPAASAIGCADVVLVQLENKSFCY